MNGGFGFHFDQNDKSIYDPLYEQPPPNQYDSFFQDGVSYSLTGQLNFPNSDELNSNHLNIGVSVMRDYLRSRAIVFDELVWGDDFEITTIAPYIGYTFYLDWFKRKATYFVNVGAAKIFYEGLNTNDYFFFDTSYRSTGSFYVNTGMEILITEKFIGELSLSGYKITIYPKNR